MPIELFLGESSDELFGGLIVGWRIGLILVPAAALYGDIARAVQFVMRFGFFLTPVLFHLPAGHLARSVMLVNPVTPVIVTGRDWLTGSGEAMPTAFLLVASSAALLFVVSLVCYKVAIPHLIERLS